MPKYLSIVDDWDPVQKGGDPLESRTWSRLTIAAGKDIITEVFDPVHESERHWINVPVFPIVEWLVNNWWALLYEPLRNERILRPLKERDEADFWWIKRHCICAADSSVLLPQLYLYNTGKGIAVRWLQDEPDTHPHMPVKFTAEAGTLHAPIDEVEATLTQFVGQVFERVREMRDDRVTATMETWKAIRSAKDSEIAFCAIAGRMGMNPYDSNEVTNSIADAIDGIIVFGAEIPVNLDLTEVTSKESLQSDLAWVRQVSEELNLGPIKVASPGSFGAVVRPAKPHDFGYRTAKWLRRELDLDQESSIDSVEEASARVLPKSLKIADRNNLDDISIAGVVGWSDRDEPILAGPTMLRKYDERFRVARGLYHALFSCQQSQRLVTAATTWDQQASRAFAAELLAPQDALVRKTDDDTGISQLASLYGVSDHVISRQLQNAGGLRYD